MIAAIEKAKAFHTAVIQRPIPEQSYFSFVHYRWLLEGAIGYSCVDTAIYALGGNPIKRDYSHGRNAKISFEQSGLELSKTRAAVVLNKRSNILEEIEKDCIQISSVREFIDFMSKISKLFGDIKKRPTGFIVTLETYYRTPNKAAKVNRHLIAIPDPQRISRNDRIAFRNDQKLLIVEGGHSDKTPIEVMKIQDFLRIIASTHIDKGDVVEVNICMIYAVRPV